MLADPSRPVVGQLESLHDQQRADTHGPAYLEYHLVALLHVVHDQKLDEIGDWEGVEQDTIDLGTVSHSEDL